MRDEGEERKVKEHNSSRFFFTLLLEIRLLLNYGKFDREFSHFSSYASQQDPCSGISAKIRSQIFTRN